MYLYVCALLLTLASVQGDTFSVNVQATPQNFPHFWEECVGSGHAVLALRSDYQRHLTQAHNELGFKRVRFHGLFDDDMSVFEIQNNQPVYSWFNVDEIFDFLLTIGMRPYVEISFMPDQMASGNQTIMHYDANITPPKSYAMWNALVTEFANHLIARYGIKEIATWTFEVWNEPNCGFWSGKQTSYFTHYLNTALALKKVNSLIRVGGPVTCQSGWIPDFRAFCAKNNVPYDFIATHEYPTDVSPWNKDLLTIALTQARQESGNLPLYYSEFNDGLYSNPAYHDTPFASAYLIKVMNDVKGLVDVLSWWTFTDIFEEGGQTSIPFFTTSGWGLLNIYQIPKPSYRAFEILHSLGTKYVNVTKVNGTSTTIGCWAVLSDKSSSIDILLYNFDVPTATVQNVSVSIVVSNLSKIPQNGVLVRIDESHANAPQAWINMGSPEYPTDKQNADLLMVSQVKPEKIAATKVGSNQVQFDLDVPKWGVAVISVPI